MRILWGKKHKDEDFFDLFVDTAELTCQAAQRLNGLLYHYENVGKKIDEIGELEHDCDTKVHDIVKQLNHSFITPIEQEDIDEIAKRLDTITDAIEDTAYSFRMFNISAIPEAARTLSDLVVQGTEELKNVMIELKHLKTSKTLEQKIIEVNRIEDEGDEVYRKAMTELFSNGADTLEVVKWKEIYEFIENSLDACEDVANVVEGVVMKNA